MPAPRKYVDQPAPSAAERQQASRARKRADGKRLIQVWLTPAQYAGLERYAAENGITATEAVQHMAEAFANVG